MTKIAKARERGLFLTSIPKNTGNTSTSTTAGISMEGIIVSQTTTLCHVGQFDWTSQNMA